MSNFRENSFIYDGNVKFNLQLRKSRAGKSYLYTTFEGDNSSVNITFFGVLAEALAAQATQGTSVIVKGYQSSRKGTDGYYQNQAIAREFSLNGGREWVTEQSLQSQHHQAYVQQAQDQLYSAPVPPATRDEYSDQSIPF